MNAYETVQGSKITSDVPCQNGIRLQWKWERLALAVWLSWLEYHPIHQKVWIQSLVRVLMGDNWLMFVFHIDVYFSLSLFLPKNQ